MDCNIPAFTSRVLELFVPSLVQTSYVRRLILGIPPSSGPKIPLQLLPMFGTLPFGAIWFVFKVGALGTKLSFIFLSFTISASIRMPRHTKHFGG